MAKEELVASNKKVIDYILDLIASRALNIGDRIEPERNLAEKLDVSRSSVREAIKVLNYIGFIDSTQGSGNYVSNRYDATVSDIMRIMYAREELREHDFVVFRRMLELEAFDLAIENAADNQKEEMLQIVHLMDVTQDPNLIFSLDRRFHSVLIEASGNYLIQLNFTALINVTLTYMSDVFHGKVSKIDKGFETLQRYHKAMIYALLEGNREKGRQAIIDHYNLTEHGK
jgi:GntR family transcriptional repressor for pyruvate dehydrogenase complex